MAPCLDAFGSILQLPSLLPLITHSCDPWRIAHGARIKGRWSLEEPLLLPLGILHPTTEGYGRE